VWTELVFRIRYFRAPKPIPTRRNRKKIAVKTLRRSILFSSGDLREVLPRMQDRMNRHLPPWHEQDNEITTPENISS
jgi:hypothetical protein